MPGLEKGHNQFLLLNVTTFFTSGMNMHDPVFCSISCKWVVVDSVWSQHDNIFELEQVGKTSLCNVRMREFLVDAESSRSDTMWG
jgi:hypothetical protein